MGLIEVGRVCIKKQGREAGKKAVIIEIKNNNIVIIQGFKVKKRKCNIKHLMVLDKKISLTGKETSEEIIKKLKV